MLRSRFPTAHHFTVSLFGCQYHADEPDANKLDLINRFGALVNNGAIYVEDLEQNDLPSKIWMSYWASPQSFKAWWERSDTRSFWTSLPDNAGFWRETVSLPATRAMYESNKEKPSGFAHCGEIIPLTEKTGYWGAYRSRMTPATPEDNFDSPLPAVPQPRPFVAEIRTGRFRIVKFPDNICFVVEGQDYSAMPDNEREYWHEKFDSLTKQWVTNVVTASPGQGMVSARACHAFASETVPGATRVAVSRTSGVANGAHGHPGTPHEITNGPSSIFPGLDYIRQAQILFWLDLSKMEHIGRWDKVHVTLRRDFFAAYGPGGVMEGGELLLWVDMGILKSEEIDAEYIGCYDGTGFLAYDDHPQFATEKVEVAGLPAFFDKPNESKPIEW
ncbi:heme-containing dehydratase protein [Dactylonectria macrodidyma]|uniref:Heme-containing dehydratase protein n=1 Tax=Dactylonectria macrodidyma TaxID=307937 RepID=A0A9P9DS80_9HYPO|nr:heme-containing dehydratase protein [Dactylonectria macrodidyma]